MNPRLVLPRLRRLAGEHKLFTGALAVGACCGCSRCSATRARCGSPGDSYVYLGAALRPQPNLSKSTGYSFFLRLLLPFHSLTLVTGVQHLMGLLVAVMIYVLLRRNGVSKTWSAIATLPLLLDGYIIEDEHLIMAETVFTFLLMVAVLLLLWRPRPAWWTAADRRAARRVRGDRAHRGRGHARGAAAVPAAARLVVEDGARLAGGDRVRRRRADPARRVRELVPRADRRTTAPPPVHGLLPVGPGVVVRRLRGHQADRGAGGGLPHPADRRPDPAGQLRLARAVRAPGPRTRSAARSATRATRC